MKNLNKGQECRIPQGSGEGDLKKIFVNAFKSDMTWCWVFGKDILSSAW